MGGNETTGSTVVAQKGLYLCILSGRGRGVKYTSLHFAQVSSYIFIHSIRYNA